MTGLLGQSQWPIVIPQIWELRLENLPELPLPVLCSVEKSHSCLHLPTHTQVEPTFFSLALSIIRPYFLGGKA